MPGTPESCNGRDDDCDGAIDDVAAVLSWGAVAGATAYDLVAGDLLALRTGGGSYSSSGVECLANDLSALSTLDSEPIPPGAGRWHLTRAVGCGMNASYDDGDASQVTSRDAEIQGSNSACP